jgi:hypothetical protein
VVDEPRVEVVGQSADVDSDAFCCGKRRLRSAADFLANAGTEIPTAEITQTGCCENLDGLCGGARVVAMSLIA